MTVNNEARTTRPSLWRKSSFGSCVEVRILEGEVEIRDSKDSEGERLIVVAPHEWAHFLNSVKSNKSSDGLAVLTANRSGDRAVVLRTGSGDELSLTSDEWQAFVRSVDAGEFELDERERWDRANKSAIAAANAARLAGHSEEIEQRG